MTPGSTWRHPTIWDGDGDSPHIAKFKYDLLVKKEESRSRKGRHRGRLQITQDWSIEDEVDLWHDADPLDGDIVRYVEALIRELRVCEAVFGHTPELTTAQRITIVRHVTAKAVACMAMMDAPVLMLVDPWPMSAERHSPKGKLKGRQNIPKLLKLGFKRMVGSRFLWAWNAELGDTLMYKYSYQDLLEAKRGGELDAVLKSSIADEIYGKLPAELAHAVDVPQPDELERE